MTIVETDILCSLAKFAYSTGFPNGLVELERPPLTETDS